MSVMSRRVYVYEGPGASHVPSNLLLSSLQRCLCPSSYSIERISPQQIRKGGWQEDCAALVFGGGYDMGYVKSLRADGANLIRSYVLNGGTYIGICAGAYFACGYIEFEKGSKIEVCGSRPLRFYPGKSIGTIAPNFKYNSEEGAAALPITVPAQTIPGVNRDITLRAYVNGGGFFSPYASAEKFPDVRNVETLAYFDSFDQRHDAVVKCEVGEKGGVAILSHLHLEFTAFELNPTDQHLMKIMRDLRNSEGLREILFKSFLRKGGLKLKATSRL